MFNSPSVLAALSPQSPATAAAPGGTWPPRVPRRGLKRPRGLWKARRRPDPATTATASSLTQHQQHQLFHTPGSGRVAKSSCSGRGSDTDREMEESCGEGEGEAEEEGEEEDGDDIMSQNSNSSKRQRRDSGSGRSSSSNIHINNNSNYNTNGMPMELWTVYVDSETDVGLPLTLGGVADTAGHGTPLPLPIPLPSGANTDTAATTRRRPASLISNMVTTSIAERVPSCSGSGPMATNETFEYGDWEEIKETLACASELCDRACIPVLSP